MMMSKAKKYYVPPVIVVYEVETYKLLYASTETPENDSENPWDN